MGDLKSELEKIENDVAAMKKPLPVKKQILALMKEHGNDWETHFDFLYPKPTKEILLARNQAAREFSAKAAGGRANAGASDKGADAGLGATAIVRMYMGQMGGPDLDFARWWTCGGNCNSFYRLGKSQMQRYDRAQRDLQNAINRPDAGGPRNAVAEAEERLATIEVALIEANEWLAAWEEQYTIEADAINDRMGPNGRPVQTIWTPPADPTPGVQPMQLNQRNRVTRALASHLNRFR